MVEPSRAIIQLSRVITIPSCKHSTGYDAVVPENSEVDLKYFEELLGSWDYSKSDNASDMRPTLMVHHLIGSPAPKKQKTDESDKTQLIHCSQLLDTSFKFNAALALAGDDPVLVNYGGTCLILCS